MAQPLGACRYWVSWWPPGPAYPTTCRQMEKRSQCSNQSPGSAAGRVLYLKAQGAEAEVLPGCHSVRPCQPCPRALESAGLARKAPLPACVLNCMPLADISQNPCLYSQFFRSFRDYKRIGLAKITSLSGRNSELTLQSRLPLPSLPTPLSSLGLTSLQDQQEESQLLISRTLERGFKEGQQLLLR